MSDSTQQPQANLKMSSFFRDGGDYPKLDDPTPNHRYECFDEAGFTVVSDWPRPTTPGLTEIFVTVDPETRERSSILINSHGTVVGGCWSSDWPAE